MRRFTNRFRALNATRPGKRADGQTGRRDAVAARALLVGCGPCARMYCVALQTSGKPIVIIGSGLAGGNAAATLREEGFPGPVVLISPEPGVPFGRPPLSKTYLRSEEDLDGWYVARPAGTPTTVSSCATAPWWRPLIPPRTRSPWTTAKNSVTPRS